MTYGSGLFDHHADLLRASGISPEVARARGYVTADNKAQLSRFGFAENQQRVPALVIPIFDVAGKLRMWQIRPDEPRYDNNGKAIKYETPYSTAPVLDVPPGVLGQLGDPAVPLWITEGARKADAAVTRGLACISLMGVWNWAHRSVRGASIPLPDWEAIALEGRTVFIAFDSDVTTKPSVQAALRSLTTWLEGRGARVAVIQLPSPNGHKVGLDDYLGNGGALEDLVTMVAVEPSNGPSTWLPLDLGLVLAGGALDEPPSILFRDDDHGLIYPGKVHDFKGEPESGKSWLAQFMCAQELEAGQTVVYVDFEDTPGSVIGRLRALGATDEAIVERFRYIRPDCPLSGEHADHFAALLDGHPAVVVIDGVTEAMAVHGLSISSNDDVAKFMETLPRQVTRKEVACVLIDHVVKDKEARGRWAIGGQHKLAGIDGASYTVEMVKPFGRDREGVAVVKVTKDRPGFVRAHAQGGHKAAEFVMASSNGTVKAELRAPTTPVGEESGFRPTGLMEKASLYVQLNPGASQNQIINLLPGKKTEAKRVAIRRLVEEGYVVVETGPRGSLLHRSIQPFREDDE